MYRINAANWQSIWKVNIQSCKYCIGIFFFFFSMDKAKNAAFSSQLNNLWFTCRNWWPRSQWTRCAGVLGHYRTQEACSHIEALFLLVCIIIISPNEIIYLFWSPKRWAFLRRSIYLLVCRRVVNGHQSIACRSVFNAAKDLPSSSSH